MQQKALVYVKRALEHHLPLLPSFERLLEEHHIDHLTFNYGSYLETDLLEALKAVSMAIVIDDLEIFGNAIQRFKMYDIPIFTVSHSLKLGYFNDECGMFVSCAHLLSFEQLAVHFKDFLRNLEQGIYHPRTWVLQHLSARVVYPHIYNVLCNRTNTLFPSDPTALGLSFEEFWPEKN